MLCLILGGKVAFSCCSSFSVASFGFLESFGKLVQGANYTGEKKISQKRIPVFSVDTMEELCGDAGGSCSEHWHCRNVHRTTVLVNQLAFVYTK